MWQHFSIVFSAANEDLIRFWIPKGGLSFLAYLLTAYSGRKWTPIAEHLNSKTETFEHQLRKIWTLIGIEKTGKEMNWLIFNVGNCRKIQKGNIQVFLWKSVQVIRIQCSNKSEYALRLTLTLKLPHRQRPQGCSTYTKVLTLSRAVHSPINQCFASVFCPLAQFSAFL